MSSKSANLHRARAAKNDEFYTQYADVKKECDNYLSHFFNKVIYCNCDTADSAFVKYFTELKAAGKIRDVWFSGGIGGDDFRCAASIERLKAADIVVTNPPFSLFREFIDLLVQYNKKFLIIGNKNIVANKKFFYLIYCNKLWLGFKPLGQDFLFDVPNPENLLYTRQKGYSYKIVNSTIKARVAATWFTNLEHTNHNFLNLSKSYKGNEHKYHKYDNCDAINIDKVSDIPFDYYGAMGVPITFVGKYNPKQFEILGRDKDFTIDGKGVSINGKNLYTRILIRKKLA
ncbi:MAG: adenine-specific methyltransferase EcoRI family protein [Alphaproteobacteria bacterium]|nr:adenine-specific methyltransferase EcoRI family protein [Alphaproteobacteria bacterium]